jgi:hypothetical protein
MSDDPVTSAGHKLASAVDTAHRIKQLEAQIADYRASLEACVREMEKQSSGNFSFNWHRTVMATKMLLAQSEENDERHSGKIA